MQIARNAIDDIVIIEEGLQEPAMKAHCSEFFAIPLPKSAEHNGRKAGSKPAESAGDRIL